MNKQIKHSLLIILLLILSSCLSSNNKSEEATDSSLATSESLIESASSVDTSSSSEASTSTDDGSSPVEFNDEYDFSKPVEGQEVSEVSIKAADGQVISIPSNLTQKEAISKFKTLKEINLSEANWDGDLHLNIQDTSNFEAKGRIRYTDHDDKHGYYYNIESGSCIYRNAATTFGAFPYSGFGYVKEDNELKSFLGRVPTASTVRTINQISSKTIIYEDPDYEPGIYGINGLPYEITDDLTPNMESCEAFKSCFFDQSFPIFNIKTLLNNVAFDNQEPIEPIVSYKLTNKYLIVTVDKPGGVFYSTSGQDGAIMYVAISSRDDLLIKTQLFYDLKDGELAYCESSFSTLDFPKYKLHPANGTFVIKFQKESDEGYLRYLNLRNEVMSLYNKKQ